MRPQKQIRQCDGLRGTRTATGRKFRDSETTCPHLAKANLLERISAMSNHFSRVMAGQQPVEDIRASTPVFDGLLRERPYVPAIHALLAEAQHKRRGCPRQARA
jgi:hypothetical protein